MRTVHLASDSREYDAALVSLAVLPTEVGDRDTTVEIHKG